MQVLQCRNELLAHLHGRGDVNAGGNDIVGGLPHVHVIVRMHQFLVAALAAQHLDGAVGDDLVGVHVRRGAGASLKDVDREMFVPVALRDFPRRGDDDPGVFLVEQPELLIHLRRAQLYQAEGADEGTREPQSADWKILHRPLCLRRPQRPGRHAHFPHGIFFDSDLWSFHSSQPFNIAMNCLIAGDNTRFFL